MIQSGQARVLERGIRVSGGNVSTERPTVSGTALIAGRTDELSFRIVRGEPNRNPLEALIDRGGAALSVAEAKANDTDALHLSGSGKPEPEPNAGSVRWIDERAFSASSWGACFGLTTTAITTPRPGTQRVVIRGRSHQDPLPAGVSVNLIYEVYEGQLTLSLPPLGQEILELSPPPQ